MSFSEQYRLWAELSFPTGAEGIESGGSHVIHASSNDKVTYGG